MGESSATKTILERMLLTCITYITFLCRTPLDQKYSTSALGEILQTQCGEATRVDPRGSRRATDAENTPGSIASESSTPSDSRSLGLRSATST